VDLVKRHAVLIGCGLVALLAIVAGVWKMTAMSAITQDMQQAVAVSQRFQEYRRGPDNRPPINKQAIDNERNRVATVQTHYTQVLARAVDMNEYTPLVDGVFPSPNFEKNLEFGTAYKDKMDGLLKLLNIGELTVGTPPSASDIAIEDERIKEEKKARMSSPEDPAGSPGRDPEQPAPTGQTASPTGVPNDEVARESAEIRSALARAMGTSCYVSPEALQRNPAIRTNDPSKAVEMWDAQVALWIQQDVIERLANVNRAAADQIKEAGGKAWVGVLPIKDLISIRVSRYVLSTGDTQQAVRIGSPGGPEPAPVAGVADIYANANASNELFDVVQFAVKMVVDVRDIPLIVDEICRDRFHRPLRINYEVVPPNVGMTGKIYGEDPCVSVVMDFESCFFGETYTPLMPDDTLAELGRQRPQAQPQG